ncbi:serine O-acetyltransferase [Hyalangium versicolor]|uniref:serine O-acetyltransferase n=1 Tax=Hyalangium versicolor TaxID=2861190 RepID=UPI00210787D4|nr:serine acetyltransferase [Hyalangium versicolor]
MDASTLWSLGRRLTRWRMPFAARIVRKLGLVLYNAYLPADAEIGEGTVLGYGGIGIFLHPRSRIGRHCVLSPFISVGGMKGHEQVPIIGDYVRIGSGARILGPVHIGDFAVVGSNSVVVRDVPAGTVVFGVPARVVTTLTNPVEAYERETGRRVSAEDRARASQPRAQPSSTSGTVRPERNDLRPGEQPDLFNEGAPLRVPEEASAYESPLGDDSKPITEARATTE